MVSCGARNSVVSLLGTASLAERSTGAGNLGSRPFSRPAQQASVANKSTDPKEIRRAHVEELRRRGEQARRGEVLPSASSTSRGARPPAQQPDPNAARRASGAAASSSGSATAQQSALQGSARGAQKGALRPPARDGRSGARLPVYRAASAAETKPLPPPPVVTKQAVEKLKGQPGVVFPEQDNPFRDDFLPPVTTSFVGVYRASQPQLSEFPSAHASGFQQGTQNAMWDRQPALTPTQQQQIYVDDILGEATKPAAAAAEAKQSSGAAVGAGAGGQMGSSSGAGSHFQMRSGKSFGGSRPVSPSRGERSVSASAAPSDTAQVRPALLCSPWELCNCRLPSFHYICNLFVL